MHKGVGKCGNKFQSVWTVPKSFCSFKLNQSLTQSQCCPTFSCTGKLEKAQNKGETERRSTCNYYCHLKAIDNKVWAQNISELRDLSLEEREAKFFLLRMNLRRLGCPGAKATHQPWKYASLSNKQKWAEIPQTDVERPVSENKNTQITHISILKSWICTPLKNTSKSFRDSKKCEVCPRNSLHL